MGPQDALADWPHSSEPTNSFLGKAALILLGNFGQLDELHAAVGGSIPGWGKRSSRPDEDIIAATGAFQDEMKEIWELGLDVDFLLYSPAGRGFANHVCKVFG